MMMKMKILFLCCALFFAGRVQASFDAIYQTYGAGMNLLSADMKVVLTGDNYSIQTSSQTKGILSWFLDAKNVFKTTGLIKGNQYRNITYSMAGLDDGKWEETAVNFDEKPGFIDYQTIMLWLMRLSVPTTQVMDVADSKRDIQMTWVYEGQNSVPFREGCLYQGVADTYALRLKVTAGKKRGWFFKKVQESVKSPFRLYFATTNGVKNMLVFSTFDTGVVGTLDICLEEIKHDENS